MIQLLLIVLIPFLLAFLYSYFVNKLSKNRFLLFTPTILGLIWFLYLFTIYRPEESVGLAGIAVLMYAFMVIGAVAGNVISALVFMSKNSKIDKNQC